MLISNKIEVTQKILLSILRKQQTLDLMKTHRPLALHYAKHWTHLSPRFNTIQEDILQAAEIGLWKAIVTYEDDKGTVLGTWAGYKIRAEIQDTIIRFIGSIRIPARKQKTEFVDYSDTDISRLSKTDTSYSQIDSECDAAVLLNSFTKKQKIITILRIYEGLDVIAIAKAIGTTRTNIHSMIRNIKKKIKKAEISPCDSCRFQTTCKTYGIEICKIGKEKKSG